MRRREFLQSGAASLLAAGGGVRSPGADPCEPLPPPIAALRPRTAEAPPPISAGERAERRARAQRLMAERGVDALFVESGPSLLYFTGVAWGRSERPFGMLLRGSGEPVLVAPAFEVERARNAAGGAFEIRGWQEDGSPYGLIAELLRAAGTREGTLALASDGRYFLADGLARAAPALRLVSADEIVHPLRGVKSPHEVEIMRFANQVLLQAYQAAFATLREGMTQPELTRNVNAAISALGFAGGAFALIGESSAYPHGAENPRPLREGDVVLVDGGLSVHGYEADITRTVAFGPPPAEVVRVYDLVRAAQSAALAAARPGVTAGSVDAAARRVITDGGFGPDYRYFAHRLGHGIGLEGHEWPYLVRGSEVVLRPGMTFSDEPGVYQYGRFGVRLEDIMVVTEHGAELLTPQAPPLR